MRLDIVIPAHNEEARIGRTLDAYSHTCTDSDVRFLVALDSCSDRTAEVVRRHRARDRRVHLIEYPRLGKGGVIAETFGRSDADLVGFVDADGATPPDEMLRLARTATRTDGAIASRRHPAAVLPALLTEQEVGEPQRDVRHRHQQDQQDKVRDDERCHAAEGLTNRHLGDTAQDVHVQS